MRGVKDRPNSAFGGEYKMLSMQRFIAFQPGVTSRQAKVLILTAVPSLTKLGAVATITRSLDQIVR